MTLLSMSYYKFCPHTPTSVLGPHVHTYWGGILKTRISFYLVFRKRIFLADTGHYFALIEHFRVISEMCLKVKV